MFNNVVDRRNTSCAKRDETIEKTNIKDIVPLTVADMDFKTSPEIIASMIEAVNHGIYGYTNISDGYIEASVNWIKRNYGRIPKDYEVVFCPRIIQAISLIIQNFTNIGDKVMISTPLYNPIQGAILSNDRLLVSSELVLENNHYEIDFEDFENIAKSGVKVFICVSPHNPTGRVWSKEEISKIVSICKKYKIMIVSDEVHADFVWKDKFISFGSFLDEYDNMIICTSPAKTFNVPGLEASNILIRNDENRSKFKEILIKAGIHNPNYFCVPAVIAAYNSSYEWLNMLKANIKDNLLYVKKFFNEIDGFKVIESEGTFLLWIDYRGLNLSEEEFKNILLKSKVLFNLGSEFGDGGVGFFRINVASPKNILEKALLNFKKQIELEKKS